MFTKTRRFALATAMLWLVYGAGGRALADLTLTAPATLSPGESFRFVFVTDGTTNATSTNIADYNNFVNTQADGATYNGSVVSWVAIASTATVNAIDNVGQAPISGVYLADGTLVTTSTTSSGLWSGSLYSAIDEDLTGPNSPGLIWTGTNPNGTAYPAIPLGSTGNGYALAGDTNFNTINWVQFNVLPYTQFLPLYGISQILTVPSVVSVPEPSTLLTSVTAIVAAIAYGRCRKRRDQRRQRPMGQPDATE